MLSESDARLLKEALQSTRKTLRAYSMAKAEREGKMKVEYRVIHHDDKPCERIPLPPFGWEVPPQGTATDVKDLMFDDNGVWATAVRSDDVPFGAFFIRPIKPPAIPEGYERVPENELQSATAYLTPHGGTVQVFVGHDFIAGGVYLRPAAPKPFRLSGPGWYRAFHGKYRNKAVISWLKIEDASGYTPDGSPAFSGLPAIIARATPEQERILEGL